MAYTLPQFMGYRLALFNYAATHQSRPGRLMSFELGFLRPEALNLLHCPLHQHLAAGGAHEEFIGAVAAPLHAPGGGQIAAGRYRELHEHR